MKKASMEWMRATVKLYDPLQTLIWWRLLRPPLYISNLIRIMSDDFSIFTLNFLVRCVLKVLELGPANFFARLSLISRVLINFHTPCCLLLSSRLAPTNYFNSFFCELLRIFNWAWIFRSRRNYSRAQRGEIWSWILNFKRDRYRVRREIEDEQKK